MRSSALPTSESGAPSTAGRPASPAATIAGSSGIWPSSGTSAPTAREPLGDLRAAALTYTCRFDLSGSVSPAVLDDADDALAGLDRDAAGPFGDLGGGQLRSGHHQDLGVGDQLGHRDGDAAGSRRQVQQQHVQIAPVHVGQELLQRAVQHRAAPHHRALPWGNWAIEMTFTSWAIGGRIIDSTWVGRLVVPIIRGMESPWMSASSTPTDRPREAIAAARLTVTDDFPTPPLPDATAYTGSASWAGRTG